MSTASYRSSNVFYRREIPENEVSFSLHIFFITETSIKRNTLHGLIIIHRRPLFPSLVKLGIVVSKRKMWRPISQASRLWKNSSWQGPGMLRWRLRNRRTNEKKWGGRTPSRRKSLVPRHTDEGFGAGGLDCEDDERRSLEDLMSDAVMEGNENEKKLRLL